MRLKINPSQERVVLAEKPADHRCDKNIIWLRVKHSDINCVGVIFNVML